MKSLDPVLGISLNGGTPKWIIMGKILSTNGWWLGYLHSRKPAVFLLAVLVSLLQQAHHCSLSLKGTRLPGVEFRSVQDTVVILQDGWTYPWFTLETGSWCRTVDIQLWNTGKWGNIYRNIHPLYQYALNRFSAFPAISPIIRFSEPDRAMSSIENMVHQYLLVDVGGIQLRHAMFPFLSIFQYCCVYVRGARCYFTTDQPVGTGHLWVDRRRRAYLLKKIGSHSTSLTYMSHTVEGFLGVGFFIRGEPLWSLVQPQSPCPAVGRLASPLPWSFLQHFQGQTPRIPWHLTLHPCSCPSPSGCPDDHLQDGRTRFKVKERSHLLRS